MKLKKRARVDRVDNDVRANGPQWGKYIYLGLLCGFLWWVFDLFFGEMVYFQANGLVVQDRVVVATQYDASVHALEVTAGQTVARGKQVATLRSQSVEESIAELSAELARMVEAASKLEVRREVIEATEPLAARRVQMASEARRALEAQAELFTQHDRLRRLQEELASLEARSQNQAELKVIGADLPKLRAAIVASSVALERLSESYAEGALMAPVDGVVAYVHVSPGSVVNKATPLMEIYTGKPFVLAYVPEGALYELAPGDPVDIEVGFERYKGVVSEILPVSSSLPDQYTDALRVPKRAPLARIEFVGTERFPTLFAQPKISASGVLPRWMQRVLGVAYAEEPPVGLSAAPAIQPSVHLSVGQVAPDPGPRFTLQYVSSGDETRAAQYGIDLGLSDAQVLTVSDGSGGARYVLVQGRFESRGAAQEAALASPHEVWVRELIPPNTAGR